MTSSLVPSAPSAPVVERLSALATRINCEHQAAQGALQAGLEHAHTAGVLLLEARALCAHGTWLPWLAEHFAGSERTAQAYMRVARRWEELTEGNPQRVTDLTYRGALAALTEPEVSREDLAERTDEEIVASAIAARKRAEAAEATALRRHLLGPDAALGDLDARIDDAEYKSIHARWEIGRMLSQEREANGGTVPQKRLTEIAQATGKSRRELLVYLRLADQCVSEERLDEVVTLFGSWDILSRWWLLRRAEAVSA